MTLRISSAPETKKGTDQIRINAYTGIAQAVIIVAADGWEYDQYDGKTPRTPDNNGWPRMKLSHGLQVRVSMNGPLRLTTEEWQELVRTVDKALQDAEASS